MQYSTRRTQIIDDKISKQDCFDICVALSNHATELEKQADKLHKKFGQHAAAAVLRARAREIVLDLRPVFGAMDDNTRSTEMQQERDDDAQIDIEDEIAEQDNDEVESDAPDHTARTYDEMTVAELVTLCRSRELPGNTGERKQDLIDRLHEYDAGTE